MFYNALFVQRYSVCEAFALAKDDIRTIIDNNEASKYQLLISDQYKGSFDKKEHKCYPIANSKEGTLIKYGNESFFNSIPSPIENFKGRQSEMCEVITLLDANRLVNILGPPGIGKTSLAKELASHLKDRKKFMDGILYISLRG